MSHLHSGPDLRPGPHLGLHRLGPRLLAALAALALFALGSVAGASAASAASGTYLRLAHLSPDTPPVDVYVTSVSDPADSLILRGVDYGTLSPYERVSGGTYTVAMRPAGSDASTPPVIATSVEATEGSAHTVAGVGRFADLGLRVLDDDLSLPPAGQARVRVIQAAASQPTLDIAVAGGQTLGSDVAFATTTSYSTVPAGPWTLRVSGDSAQATLPISLDAGSVYSVLVLDQAGGGLTLSSQVDAASTEVVPAGAVETGAGGTATRPLSTPFAVLSAGLLLLAGGVVLWRRSATR